MSELLNELTYRKANVNDLPQIVNLLAEDELGKTRERGGEILDPAYFQAFKNIESDPNQYLMVVLHKQVLIATCHLTIMPSLTYMGSTRMQIEAVRVADKYRGQGIGQWMINIAIDYAKENGVVMIQLTTNKHRERAYNFYKQLGFQDTHIGMKLFLD